MGRGPCIGIISVFPFIGRRVIVKGKEFVEGVIPLKSENRVIGTMGITLFFDVDPIKGLLGLPDFGFPHSSRRAINYNSDIHFEDIIGNSGAPKSVPRGRDPKSKGKSRSPVFIHLQAKE